jgi:hypothetical protein
MIPREERNRGAFQGEYGEDGAYIVFVLQDTKRASMAWDEIKGISRTTWAYR